MKKRFLGIAGAILLLSIVFGVGTVYGASSKPGSSGDPLITLSYLNERLSDSSTGAAYKKVTLEKGKTLILNQGSVAILYSGSAKVTGNEGVIDISASGILKTGSQVKQYHSYLSPSNASGLAATARTVIFVQGGYTIK